MTLAEVHEMPVNRGTIDAAAGSGNSQRPLTDNLDTSKERLMMQPTDHAPNSPRWRGHPRRYQAEAHALYRSYYERPVFPWAFITTDCDVDHCLDPECMTLHSPRELGYLPEQCIYCGESGFTRDHLLPEPLTGKALRALVLVVPSCRSCNSAIGDLPTANVAERRRHAQLSVERKHRQVLLTPQRTDAEMEELSLMLRSVAEKYNVIRARAKARLSWPDDPFFDLRAFQRAGIDDPAAMGLCDEIATPLRPEYREAA